MKTKIYTATIVVEDFLGKEGIGGNMYCESFANENDRQKWLDDKYCEIVRERGADDEGHNWACYQQTAETELDIPVFVFANVDYHDTDYNCGIVTQACPTKEQAVEILKESIREEVEAGTIDRNAINWHRKDGKHTIDDMPDTPEIADTYRFGWTIDEH